MALILVISGIRAALLFVSYRHARPSDCSSVNAWTCRKGTPGHDKDLLRGASEVYMIVWLHSAGLPAQLQLLNTPFQKIVVVT